MGSLRKGFGIGIGLLLAASIVLHVLAIATAQASYPGDGTIEQPSYAVPTLLSTLATFCTSAALVLVLGIVALLVIDAAFLRKLEIDAFGPEGDNGESGDSGEGGAVPAYGSDPELL